MAPFKIRSTQASMTQYKKLAVAYLAVRASRIAKNAEHPYPMHGRRRCQASVYVWRVSQREMKSRRRLAVG
jgi:hypothetical protein